MINPRYGAAPGIPGYEIERLIGIGGMGEVHLARQVALNRPVAIKFLTGTVGGPLNDYEARFRREAELMAQVSHPNVVTIFDFGAVAGRAYLVMEYVDGGDLRSRMFPDVPMPIVEIRAIMKPVLKALEFLHARGIVHRDMKPENILMHREETPKVTDFGIAVLDFAIGSLTRTGHSLGTPGYVAPEQQYGLKVDTRADQFSMAALCYEMGTGRKPLGAFASPEKINPKLGPKVGTVLMKALSEDPTDRFATIAEFGVALDQALGEALIGKRLHRKLPIIAAIVAVVPLLIAAATYLSTRPQPIPKVVADAVPVPKAPPQTLPVKLIAKSVGMTLVLIPAGEFRMGSPPDDPEAHDEELPSHRVQISQPFYMGEKEVTQGQFRKYIELSGNKTSAEVKPADGEEWGGFIFDLKAGKFVQRPELNWKNPRGDGRPPDEEPVVQVSWDDAIKFCKWLSKQEGRPFRLATEAEWEYACRAGSTTRWSFGDDPAMLNQFAWNINNAGNSIHPVGLLKPNAFGLFDMHGNVWEWCADEFGKYTDSDSIDPEGPRHKMARVLRGGSLDWKNVEKTRSASRFSYPPHMCYCNYGFRVCSTAP